MEGNFPKSYYHEVVVRIRQDLVRLIGVNEKLPVSLSLSLSLPGNTTLSSCASGHLLQGSLLIIKKIC